MAMLTFRKRPIRCSSALKDTGNLKTLKIFEMLTSNGHRPALGNFLLKILDKGFLICETSFRIKKR
jgi:hypothetical protein